MLDREKAEVAQTRRSKSSPLNELEVGKLLQSVDEVVVAKGKSARVLAARDATLDDLRGPTGSFRAPMLKVGRRLLVGYHEAALRETLGL